jgi:uncharacterized iron-regulated membrane protein
VWGGCGNRRPRRPDIFTVTISTTSPSQPDPAPAPTVGRARRGTARRRPDRQSNRLLKRLHFFAGIICAPLILVASVTGLLYAFAPTIEKVVYHDMLTASAPENPADAEPVSDLVRTARAEHPDLPLAGVRLGKPDETTRVLFSDPDLPESTLRAVFLDPYTGEVKGDTTQYGSSASLPFRQWLSDGHRKLWLGENGRLYSETAASWLGVLAVGGVAMWWTRNRSVKAMLRTGGKGRTRTMRRHGATGTVIAVGMVFLTVTGLTWSSVAGTNIGEWRQSLNWGTPSVSTDLPGMPAAVPGAGDGAAGHAGHAGHEGHQMAAGASMVSGLNAGSVDRVAATALTELRAPLTITPPTAEGAAWTAAEDRTSYRLSNDAVAVDWATGEVSDRLDFADWPWAAKASAWLIQLHMGTLFGWVNQLVLGLLAAAIIAMVGFGYVMWWRRRPRTGGAAVAGAPPRAGWGRPTRGTLLLAAVLVVYSVIAPLFGITCAVFLVVSAGYGLVGRAVAPAGPGVPGGHGASPSSGTASTSGSRGR